MNRGDSYQWEADPGGYVCVSPDPGLLGVDPTPIYVLGVLPEGGGHCLF